MVYRLFLWYKNWLKPVIKVETAPFLLQKQFAAKAIKIFMSNFFPIKRAIMY